MQHFLVLRVIISVKATWRVLIGLMIHLFCHKSVPVRRRPNISLFWGNMVPLYYAWHIWISWKISIPKYCWRRHYKQYIHETPQNCSWQQNQISCQELEEYNDVWYVNFLRIDTFGKSRGTVNKKEQNSRKTWQPLN